MSAKNKSERSFVAQFFLHTFFQIWILKHFIWIFLNGLSAIWMTDLADSIAQYFFWKLKTNIFGLNCFWFFWSKAHSNTHIVFSKLSHTNTQSHCAKSWSLRYTSYAQRPTALKREMIFLETGRRAIDISKHYFDVSHHIGCHFWGQGICQLQVRQLTTNGKS